jgi:PKD repeat protein
VTLEVENACGTDTWTEEICVCQPVDGVDFSWDPETGIAGEEITFTAAEPLTGTAPFTYTWDFGDETEMGIGMTVTHVYEMAGVYTVTLTVENACGMAMVEYVVTVEPAIMEIYIPILLRNS